MVLESAIINVHVNIVCSLINHPFIVKIKKCCCGDCRFMALVDCLLQEKVGLGSSAHDTGKGRSKMSKKITHGYHLVKGKSNHPMEDYVVAEFKQVDNKELGLFAIFDGHLSHDIPNYLCSHLFVNILNEVLHASCKI